MKKIIFLLVMFIIWGTACTPTEPPVPPEDQSPVQTATGTPPAHPDVKPLISPEQVPGPVRECIEEALGPDAWNQIVRQERQPDAYEAGVIEGCFAQQAPPPEGQSAPPEGEEPPLPPAGSGPIPLDTTSPLPSSPAGEMISIDLGPVRLEAYNPVTITPLENATNIYIYVHNNGDGEVTVQGPRGWEVEITVIEAGPPQPKHFFELNPYPTVIPAGETVVFEFMTTRGDAEVEMVFPFTLIETGEQAELALQVISEDGGGPIFEILPQSAAIQGQVTTPDGASVSNAEVAAYLYNNAEQWRGQTDGDGNYFIALPSTDDIQAMMGDRPLPYDSLGYTVIVAPDGYTPGQTNAVELSRGETGTVDLVVRPVESRSYNLIGELTTGGAHGYWWLLPLPNFESLAAVQGRHPPETGAPGHIIMVSLEGEELWRVPTNTECWGFDVSVNGDIAAGCHDGMVYLVDSAGNLRWEFQSGSMNRWVRFSPDGNALLTGPNGADAVVLLDTATGQPLWSYGDDLGWLRNAVWSPDGERVLTGHGGGMLAMFTRQGELLWQGSIGEFPMVLEMDTDYNTYLAGKSRELFSFDTDGNLRWRYRIATHVVTAGANNMSAAGDKIAMGTVSGWVLVYDSEGELLWQRQIGGTLQGHNALDMTPDGRLIVVGSAGEAGNNGYISLFDGGGALLWRVQYPDGRDQGTVPAQYGYDHNHRGAITVAISDDGHYIAAGFGDSSIRIFEYAP